MIFLPRITQIFTKKPTRFNQGIRGTKKPRWKKPISEIGGLKKTTAEDRGCILI